MRPINFINGHSVNKYYAIRFWMIITLITLFSIIITLGIFQILQWQVEQTLIQEKKILEQKLLTFHSSQTKINILKVEKENLDHKLNMVNVYTKQPRNPISLLRYIKNISAISSIETLYLEENSLALKIVTKDTQSLLQAANGLSQQPICNGLSLCGIEYKGKDLLLAFLKTETTQL